MKVLAALVLVQRLTSGSQATCALRELLAVEEFGNLAKQNLPALLCVLFTRIASCVEVPAKEKASPC